jgi:hypothetical protein
VTLLTPVERVVAILEASGYRRLSMPFEIATLRFDVSAALVGTGQAADLVLVFDSATSSDRRLVRSVEGISRALDVVGSRRPLTAVLVGPAPPTQVLADLSKVGRVLPIGTAGSAPDDQPIKDWLAALLPLSISPATALVENPLAGLETAAARDPVASALLRAARSGKEPVAQEFLRQIDAALSDVQKRQGS